MAHKFIVYNKTTGLFRVEGLEKFTGNDKSYVNNATVTLENIFNSGGTDVLGTPKTLDYIAGSNGDYELAYLIDLDVEAEYKGEMKVVSGTLQKIVYPNLLIKEDVD